MSRILYSRLLVRKLGSSLLATIITLGLLSVVTTNVFAGAVNIYDFAGVLNKSQVSNEASSLAYAMDIYTTNTFSGSQQQFASEIDGKINQNNKVVMSVDVRNHYVYLDGRGVSLSRNQYQDAANAFSSSFRSNQDYTNATIAAIDMLRGNANTGSNSYLPGGNSFGLSTLCCIGFLVLAALALFGIFRSRRSGGNFFNSFNRGFNRRPVVPPYDPYNQGPHPPNYQGPYPPDYGPGYPNYNQGMNPLAAGGVGAVGGGLLGYELGKEQGEREMREEDRFDQGANYGGDVGGGAGADFGSGNDNSGDWGGGGAGADFGGGSDFGGGGSGNDFGGGGGDNGGGAGSNF